MDSEAMCQHVFSRVPAEHFHSPMLAFEFAQFCRDSLPLLGCHLSIFRRSFPSLFKARAGRGGAQWPRLPHSEPPGGGWGGAQCPSSSSWASGWGVGAQ